MSTPVDPQLMRVMQLKREAGVKLAIWAVASVLALAAGIGVLALAYILGGGEALAMTAAVLFAVVFFFVPMGLMGVELDNPVTEYLYQSRQLAELKNEVAWNAQQEEIVRLRTIMKEEGL